MDLIVLKTTGRGSKHDVAPEDYTLPVSTLPISTAPGNTITTDEEGLVATGATPESVLALINDCEGSPMTPGVSLPTCEQMDNAIQDGIENAPGSNSYIKVVGGKLVVDAAAVIATLKSCGGASHSAADPIPTCTEMNQAIEDALSAPCLVNVITTSGARTIALTDAGALLLGSANTLTISDTIQYPIGFRLDIKGAATVAAASGQTIQSMDDAKKVVANGGASLVKTGTNTWWLVGALEA